MAGVKVQGFRIWKTGKRELALNIGQMFGREIQAKMGRVFFWGGGSWDQCDQIWRHFAPSAKFKSL